MNNGGPSGAPVISGTPIVGQNITVNVAGVSDPDGIASFVRYTWYADGVAIAGNAGTITDEATISFTLTSAQLGKTVTVEYAYEDHSGNVETATSDGVLVYQAGAIVGTNGDDQSISGTSANDTILAGAGIDWIIGSSGNDVLNGGMGDSDVVMYSDLSAGVFINNTARQIGTVGAYRVAKAGGQQDTITGIEAFHGSQFADTIYVGSNTYVFAEGGNDKISVGTSVLVLPGSGNDTITALGESMLDYEGGDGSADQTQGIVAVWTAAKGGVVANDGWGGKDRFTGITGISGSNFADVITGNTGNDRIVGNDGDDVLTGNDGSDWITGGDGHDELSGGAGSDDLDGGDGDDLLSGGDGHNRLDGGTGNDTYYVQSDVTADDEITDAGGDADILQVLDTANRDALRLVYDGNTLVHETAQGHRTTIALDENGAAVIEYLQWVGNPDYGTDDYTNTLRIITDLSNITGRLIAVAGSDGNDVIDMPSEAPQEGEYWGEVYANGGDDTITLSQTMMYVTYAGDGNDSVYGSGDTADLVAGEAGNDLLDGGNGNDTLFGDDGDDTLWGGAGDDSLVGGAANPNRDDGLFGGDGDDTLVGGTGDTYIEGGAGNDLILGGSGHDQITYQYSSSGVIVDLVQGYADDGMGGTDTISGVEMVRGSYFGDTLVGDAGDNQFRGLQGDDSIDGGDGTDRVGYDRDEDRGATLGVVVDLAAGTATDGWGDSDTLTSIENVRGSIWEDYIAGNSDNNRLEGNSGDDTILGHEGFDDLSGDAGNDRLIGGAGGDQFYGGTGDDSAFGDEGEDWIHYEDGDDFFDGGDGFDRADYRDAPDAVRIDLSTGLVQDGGGFTDTLVNVERVTGSAFDDQLFGNNGDINSFTGGLGNDLIDGRDGWDYVWYGDSASAVIVDLQAGTARGGEGQDTLISIEGLGGSNFSDTLLGSDADNWIEPDYEGNAFTPNGFVGGNDYIDGRGGFDTVAYWQAVAGITANLATGTVVDGQGNTDRLISIEGIDGSNYADLITGSAGDDRLSGRDGDDTLSDGGGNDTVLGDGGQDVLLIGAGENLVDGGAGDDSYVFRYAGDTTVTDTEGDNWLRVEKIEGVRFSTVYINDEGGLVWTGTNGTKITFTDPSHLAGFTFVPFAREFSTYDIAMADVAIGTLGGDTLYSSSNGYAEAYGAEGNDTIFVESMDGSWITGDDGDDLVHGGEGDDNLYGDLFNTYTGNDILFGNGGADTIWGGNGEDQLYGGDGDDEIFGGAGDDLIDDGLGVDVVDGGDGIDTFSRAYEFATAFDWVLGIDLVLGGVYLPSDPFVIGDYIRNIENIAVTGDAHFILQGNGENNALQSADGNDTLEGRGGADTLTGGAGDDTYITDGADSIEEDADQGTDTVRATVSYTLGDHLENLTLIGTASINATGNALGNSLTGNSGANVLDGREGSDILAGGAGNDTYMIDAGDTVVENLREGTDLVIASITHTLANNVENLTLTGANAIDGTGNALNNTLRGNGAANTLSGREGIDQLIGGAGKDMMTGGAGTDSFVFNTVSESANAAGTADIITDFLRGTDKIDLGAIDAFAPSAKADAFIWKGTAAFASSTQGEVRFQKFDVSGTADDYTMVFMDNDGDAAVEMAIRLNGLFNLTASDFIL